MDDRLFRQAMGKFATGVTVITTKLDGDVHGMTANAFMSVSLHPKLVVISIQENAAMLDKIKQSQSFAINILAANQQELSMIFAGQIKEPRDVHFEDFQGQAVLPGALAHIVCDVSAEHVEGDHTLFIGQVTGIQLEEHDPLLFFNGQYRFVK